MLSTYSDNTNLLFLHVIHAPREQPLTVRACFLGSRWSFDTLTIWLLCWVRFFKTSLSSVLLMFKSKQHELCCCPQATQQYKQKGSNGDVSKKAVRSALRKLQIVEFSKFRRAAGPYNIWKPWLFKSFAARRARIILIPTQMSDWTASTLFRIQHLFWILISRLGFAFGHQITFYASAILLRLYQTAK